MAKKHWLDGYKTYDSTKGFGNDVRWRQTFRERMSHEEAEATLKNNAETPYTILGVSPGDSAETIKKAFRRLITEWHPDRNQHRLAEAEEKSKQLIAAYTLLTA